MSRCFPYPPPGYCRNGATYEALIESIKLQKETVKAVKDKSERKKEKREKKEKKEKKRKEKKKEEEKPAFQKNPNEFQPNSKEACFEKTEPKTVTDPRTEHLEKSDLTEELCQPTNSQKPSYSSDSTQNSNKRKRDEVSIPDGSSGHGKPIKIRLLKKHKPDSDKVVLCTDSGRSNTTCLTGADARLKLVSSNRTTGVPLTPGRENIPVHGHLLSQTKTTPSSERLATKSNDLQRLQFSSKQSDPSSSASLSLPLTRLKYDSPSSYSIKTNVQVPSTLKKSDVEGLPSSRQQPVSVYGKPLLPPNQKVVSSLDVNKAKSIAAGKRPFCEITVPDNSCPTRFVKRKDLISDIPKNVLPGSSGPTRVLEKNEERIPSFFPNKTDVQVPSRLKKSDVEELPSSRQQPISGYGNPLLPPNQKVVSSSDFNKAKSIAAGKRPICEITVPDNSCPTRFVKRKEDLISDIPKNVLPCSSGPTRVEEKNEDLISGIPKNVVPNNSVSTRIERNDDLVSKIPEKASLTRHEKKLQKKYSKYKKVIGSWVPPVLEAQLPVDDEDWLSRKGAKVASSSRDDVETSQELAPSSLWQPCARYLVEADVYALPYTFPF